MSTSTLPVHRDGRPADRRPGRLSGLRASASTLLVAVALQSAGNLVFHGVSGHLLTPAEYGALGTLLAATTALAVPLGALQAAASHLVARHGAERATAVRLLLRTTGASSALALALLPLAPACARWWHLDGSSLVLPVLAYAVVSAVCAAVRGLLLGAGAVSRVAATYVTSTVLRLAAGIPLTLGLGILGALLATVLGELAALAVGLGGLRRHCSGAGPARSLDLPDAVRPLGAVAGLFLLSTVDLLLARHVLSADQSGAYVAAATLGKTVLALPAALMSASYPRLVRAWSGGGAPPREVLRRTLVLVCGSAAAFALAGAVVPSLLLGALYGTAYSDQTLLLRCLLGVAAVTSVATTLTYAALARGARTAWVPWLGAALEVGLIASWHPGPLAVAAASAVATLPTVIALAAVELPAWRRRHGSRISS